MDEMVLMLGSLVLVLTGVIVIAVLALGYYWVKAGRALTAETKMYRKLNAELTKKQTHQQKRGNE